MSPMFRAAIDGPARNTRQTNQSKTPALPTPPSSFHSRASFSDAPPSYQTPRAQPTPASTAQRKGGRRAAMTVNTPITPAPQSKGGSSLAMSPTDFNTTNLESHLKRKRPDINVEGLLKEVTESRTVWERSETESEDDAVLSNGKVSPPLPSAGFYKPPVPQRTPLAARPPTPTSQEPVAPIPRHGSPTLRRPMSGMSPIPSQIKTRNIKPQRLSADGDVEMHDFDASSSDDDDDGGYRSDGVQGNDDDLYSVPPRRPMQGEALEFRNGESSTFGSMLSGSTGLFSQFPQMGPTSAAVPSLPMSGFALQNGGTTLLNGGGIAPTVSYTPSVTINPAVLMRGSGDHSTPSPTSMMSMVNMTAALLQQTHQQEPEIPKHVRFAIPGIGGDLRHQEGVNGASG